MKTRPKWALAALSMAIIPMSHAADIEWNGFLNVVGGILRHEPRTDFNTDKQQYPGYRDYSSNLSFDSQTSAGLQAKTMLDERMAVTTQLYAEGFDSTYTANLKWLFVTYAPTYNSTFRVGKIGTPFYYYSDFLNVGYAYHWISPPDTVYPFDTTITGIDYTYQDVNEHFDWSIELLAGSSEEFYPTIQTDVSNRNSVGMVFNASTANGVSARAMLYQTDSSMRPDVLAAESLNNNVETAVDTAIASIGLDATTAQLIRPSLVAATQAHLGTDWTGEDRAPIRYAEVAVRSDWGRWMLMGEWIGARNHNYLFNQATAAYLTGGVRVDQALFHVTYSRANNVLNERAKQDIAAEMPSTASIEAVGDYLASQIRAGYALLTDAHLEIITGGVRYDVSANTALKLELTRINSEASRPSETAGIGSNVLLRAAINATF